MAHVCVCACVCVCQETLRDHNQARLHLLHEHRKVTASTEHLEPGTFYLTRIDEQFIRYYAVKGAAD